MKIRVYQQYHNQYYVMVRKPWSLLWRYLKAEQYNDGSITTSLAPYSGFISKIGTNFNSEESAIICAKAFLAGQKDEQINGAFPRFIIEIE